MQRAAPIICGFLLGYVAMLPLIGRIADLRGPVPVLVGCAGALRGRVPDDGVAYDLPSMVAGRVLQGMGGGGLVPATLALVAELYPVERRGLPLGMVSAVPEIGSVLGPLFGAGVLAVAAWRAIFAINLAVGLLLAAAIRCAGCAGSDGACGGRRTAGWLDRLGAGPRLLVPLIAGRWYLRSRPASMMRDLTWADLHPVRRRRGGR